MQYKEIQKKFNEVITASQGIDNPQTDELFDRWLDAKRDFIEAMDGQLIWEWPEQVAFELGNKEKNLRVDDFVELIQNRWQNDDLADFILFEKDGFFSNQVTHQYMCPQKNLIIPQGMKLLKAFKFFENDVKVLNDMQSAASMIIQEDKITGTLCLSVHPLDYLSLSENTHNWRSCHALDGEYRGGNLSYMIDRSTIICYIRSNRDDYLANFGDVKWNSKKWRVLLFFSTKWDMLFAGRQYPFITEAGLDFVRESVLPAAHLNEWSSWCVKKIKTFSEHDLSFHFRYPYVPIGDSLISMNELIRNEPGSLQFNDLLSSSCYDPMYAYKMSKNLWWGQVDPLIVTDHFARFYIGGRVRCLRCGKKDIELTESVMCNDCELEYGTSESDLFGYCPCCGRRFIYDDGYWVNGSEETVCPDCADEYTEYCSSCGDRYYKEDMIYNRDTQKYMCKWCAEDN